MSSKQKERLLVVYRVVVFAAGAITVKMSLIFCSIMISLEKSVSTWQFPVNKVIKFGPCWEAPYLWLVTYCRISSENGGRNTKTPALKAGAPFPFLLFRAFLSLPTPYPFCACRAKTVQLPVTFSMSCQMFKSILFRAWRTFRNICRKKKVVFYVGISSVSIK